MLQSTQSTYGGSANIYHQLVQRELNLLPQRNPRTFSGLLFTQRYRVAKNLFKTDLRAHYGCVNAIEFSNGGKYLASGGDDKRVLIWDIEKAITRHDRPRILQTEHTSNIFCLGFDRCNRIVLSGGNDDLVVAHDFETGKLVNVFKHNNPVYGLSIDPKCDSIFATACEDGQILVFDQRVDAADPLVVAQQHTSFHAVEFHPAGGNFLVTANSKRGAAFWDIRKPHHPVIQYGGHVDDPLSCMSVRFNSNGSLILALRRRLPPILYNTQSPEPVCTFYHGNYYNSCTMKSCTFAGENDEFVLSGSDDFNLYVWRVSDVNLERTDQWVESTQMVLYGHRSIVNQVRYNPEKCLLASSGVEKIVKLWSPFTQKDWSGSLLEEATCSENPRELYSPYNFTSMSTSPHSWSHMSHDYSSRNTNEDPRMMAFFDSLIQQEIEGWDADSSTDSSHNSDDSHSCSSSNDSSDSSPDDESDDDDDNDDGDGRNVVSAGISVEVNVPEVGGIDRENIVEQSIPTENSVTRERATRHVKRRFTKRKDLKRRKSVSRKRVKPQRHAFANRIAYLIATKRSRLRRLAIKGASLGNRRPYKILKVRDNGSGKCEASCSKSMRSNTYLKRHQSSHRRNLNLSRRNNFVTDPDALNGNIASTSNAASSSQAISAITSEATTGATGISNSHRYQRKKYKKHSFCDTSSDDSREPTGTISSIPSNAPSTSTGITTTLKDDIIRLRQHQQHIIDSDEYEDDDIMPSLSSSAVLRRNENAIDVEVDPTIQPTKKLNGVRRINDAAIRERGNILNEPIDNSERLISFSVEPVFDAHSIIATNSMQADIENPQISSSGPSHAIPIMNNTVTGTIETTQLPHTHNVDSLFNNHNNGNINNSSESSVGRIVISNRRRRAQTALLDNYSSHSNSRLSNSSYPDEAVESSTSSSCFVNDAIPGTNEYGLNPTNGTNSGNEDNPNSVHVYTTPLKRRKIAILSAHDDVEAVSDHEADAKWSHSNSNNNMVQTDFDYPVSSNRIGNSSSQTNFHHNSVQTNGICVGDDEQSEEAESSLHKSHHRDIGGNNSNNISNASHHNYEVTREQNQQNITMLLRTPDSGISIGATITPNRASTICPSSNDSTTSRWHHSNGTLSSSDGGTTPVHNPSAVGNNRLLPLCDDTNTNAGPIGLFHQKVARIRRNYRKKFAEDSDESD